MRVEGISIGGLEVSQMGSAKFLGIVLDYKLNGTEYLNLLIKKGNSVANIVTSLTGEVSRLTTSRLDTTNHSDRCLEAFHCSSAMNGSCPIDSCPNGGHPLTGTRWEAHPHLLLFLYRSIYRSSIEYGAQIFNLNKNRSLFLKLQKQQYRIIRAALGLRQSTAINIFLSENLP